jgi:3-isopropylmalate dehydratase small subunit
MNWIFGDNINTDLITPGRYNTTTDPEQLGKIAFIEYRPEFAQTVRSGDWIIAGNNFGCGSSRETAVTALKACGIHAIVARSFARIFYRNCINLGLLAILANPEGIREQDRLEVDLASRRIRNGSGDVEIAVEIPELMITLHNAGGIISFLQNNPLSALMGKSEWND